MTSLKYPFMHNVGIVVEDLDSAIGFFTELGLDLEGRMPIECDWSGRVTGLRGQRSEIAMMRTPDGHNRLELSRFSSPAIASDHRNAPENSLGYLRVMFTVGGIDDTLFRLSKLGASVVDEAVNYEEVYRLCYIRGPEGILIGLAQQPGDTPSMHLVAPHIGIRTGTKMLTSIAPNSKARPTRTIEVHIVTTSSSGISWEALASAIHAARKR
jgi:catechol 2,3-dioxygenase-like lactoylglutathione lyase family enzyme